MTAGNRRLASVTECETQGSKKSFGEPKVKAESEIEHAFGAARADLESDKGSA